MKAIILAAGEGRRLRPLTNDTPKVLLPLNGKPVLEYWLDKCEMHRINEVLINGHYRAELLEAYLDRVREKYSFVIQYVYEESLLGTGGTVKQNRQFVASEDFFLLCHGDNFTNIDLSAFIAFHRRKASPLSVAMFRTNIPQQCGIIEEIDADGRIIKFVEKPRQTDSDLASAAIFLMSPIVIERFPDKQVIDFSSEILPLYPGNMFGFLIDGYNIDIGTLGNYELAERIAAASGAQNF